MGVRGWERKEGDWDLVGVCVWVLVKRRARGGIQSDGLDFQFNVHYSSNCVKGLYGEVYTPENFQLFDIPVKSERSS